MRILESLAAMAELSERYRSAGLSVGFVPTMGALHQGHVSLFTEAKRQCDRCIVSIFVNPTQFGPGEDFAAYPRPREADAEACRGAGVDVIFFARAEEIYPPGFQTWVTVEDVSKPLCGRSRPVHFRGVATVVAQLLALVRPHRAYFGQKDYQQCLVIKRLVTDLHLGTEIHRLPTWRESDGLAMSSRNQYLDAAARLVAPRIHRALVKARDLILAGEVSVERVLALLRGELTVDSALRLDYAEVCDAQTLEGLPGGLIEPRGRGVVIAVAALVGKARLIDNILVP